MEAQFKGSRLLLLGVVDVVPFEAFKVSSGEARENRVSSELLTQ